MVALIVVGVITGAMLCAWAYDTRQRRRGVALRAAGAVETEAMHHRADINAIGYEPARHAGQRDWATYRMRDRKRRVGGSA